MQKRQQMATCKEIIESLKDLLPELASPQDLVKMGVYRSEQAAYSARLEGNCPPWIRIPGRGIVYPRQGVLEFLEKHAHEPKPALIKLSNFKMKASSVK